MAVNVTVSTGPRSMPLNLYSYKVTGLVNGANTINLPTPPAAGSFPPLGDWTPVFVWAYPFAPGGAGALVTPDLGTITNTNGAVSFTLYATGATSALIFVA